jgi:hypothetical protein
MSARLILSQQYKLMSKGLAQLQKPHHQQGLQQGLVLHRVYSKTELQVILQTNHMPVLALRWLIRATLRRQHSTVSRQAQMLLLPSFRVWICVSWTDTVGG